MATIPVPLLELSLEQVRLRPGKRPRPSPRPPLTLGHFNPPRTGNAETPTSTRLDATHWLTLPPTRSHQAAYEDQLRQDQLRQDQLRQDKLRQDQLRQDRLQEEPERGQRRAAPPAEDTQASQRCARSEPASSLRSPSQLGALIGGASERQCSASQAAGAPCGKLADCSRPLGPTREEQVAAVEQHSQLRLCQLTARTRNNQCALHGRPAAVPVPVCTSQARAQCQPRAPKTSGKTRNSTAQAPRPSGRRTPKDKAKSVATWPVAKQTLDNNQPEETRLGHFGDCEDLLSAHLAGRLFGGLKCHQLAKWQESSLLSQATSSMVSRADCLWSGPPSEQTSSSSSRPAGRQASSPTVQVDENLVQLEDELSATNYNHKRLFAFPYEAPPTGWLQNATGLACINPGSSAAVKG